jgi:hypothetical protein
VCVAWQANERHLQNEQLQHLNLTIFGRQFSKIVPIPDGIIQIVWSSISRLDATANEMIGGFAAACVTVYWLVIGRVSFIWIPLDSSFKALEVILWVRLDQVLRSDANRRSRDDARAITRSLFVNFRPKYSADRHGAKSKFVENF